jgi:uncharacterized protein YecT (DUF1311 family)
LFEGEQRAVIRIILAALAAVTGVTLAAPAYADDAYDKCMDDARTNPDFSMCGSAMLDRREAELNRAWKEAYTDLDPAVKKALLDEQRAWIVYKDKSCLTWTTGFYGREGQVIGFYTCRRDVIDARITDLENLGDTGGPDADAPKEGE